MLKQCSKCNNQFAYTNFYKNKKNKDGYRSDCKNCGLEYQKNNRDKVNANVKKYELKYPNKKILRNKKLRQQYKETNIKTKLLIVNQCCNKCDIIKKINEFSKNSMVKTGYNIWCKSCLKKANQDYNKRNPEQKRKDTANYRSRKINRTPKWADLNKIAEIYKNCPKDYHVDHVIPLNGENISGLHVHNNLQYLTVSDNCRKRNVYKL